MSNERPTYFDLLKEKYPDLDASDPAPRPARPAPPARAKRPRAQPRMPRSAGRVWVVLALAGVLLCSALILAALRGEPADEALSAPPAAGAETGPANPRESADPAGDGEPAANAQKTAEEPEPPARVARAETDRRPAAPLPAPEARVAPTALVSEPRLERPAAAELAASPRAGARSSTIAGSDSDTAETSPARATDDATAAEATRIASFAGEPARSLPAEAAAIDATPAERTTSEPAAFQATDDATTAEVPAATRLASAGDAPAAPPPVETAAAGLGTAETAGRARLRPAKKVFAPPPDYPDAARRAGLEGAVVVEARVDERGAVTGARVVEGGAPLLDRSALDAVERWRFEPATIGGEPVSSPYRISFRFGLEDAAAPGATQPGAPQPGATQPGAPQPGATQPGAPQPRPAAPETPQPAASAPALAAAASARASGAPEILELGDGIEPPRRLVSPLPAYPDEAWASGVTGDVVVKATIDERGEVADVEVVRGLPYGITEAAVAAIRRWKFRPALRGEEPVAVYHNLSIRFAH